MFCLRWYGCCCCCWFCRRQPNSPLIQWIWIKNHTIVTTITARMAQHIYFYNRHSIAVLTKIFTCIWDADVSANKKKKSETSISQKMLCCSQDLFMYDWNKYLHWTTSPIVCALCMAWCLCLCSNLAFIHSLYISLLSHARHHIIP